MITDEALKAAQEHALSTFPRESCGVVIRVDGAERYHACRNAADDPLRDFVIPGEDFADAEDRGEVVAIVHSHPNGVARASHVDRLSCEEHGYPFGVIALGGDPVHLGSVAWVKPEGWKPPLVGREFHYGVLDCYTLVRDFYEWELGITLPEFDHGPDQWWNKSHPNYRPEFNPYMDNFALAGFGEARGELERGDLILMQIRADVPNHCGIYIGDGVMLHHAYNRLSERVVYGGMWAELTRKVIRRGGL